MQDPFMVLSKHQEAGIKDLMRKSKGFGEAGIYLGIKSIEIGQSDCFVLSASTPEEVLKRMQNVPYASAVGSIMYVVRCTRPDVAFAQNITSRFQQNPSESHWTAVKNILKYLRNTKDMFLVYGGNPKADSHELKASCDDVDWGKASKQSILKWSAIEAEYISLLRKLRMEAVWIRPNREDPLRNMRMKIEIPEFEGKAHPDDFIDWLSTIERIFDLRDIPDHLKLKNKGRSTSSRVTPSSRFTSTTPVKTPTLKPDTPSASAPQSVIQCFKCQGLSHLKRDCLNKQLVSLVEDTPTHVYDTYDDGEANDDDEVVYPDSGEALITQRVLNVAVTKAVDDASWLRNNIFRGTTKGKVRSVIIDGGSCKNMVATSMVEKLGLDTQDHPEPYQLTWLKKGNVVKVSKRCLVYFSIGKKYNDEVWCEVIPIDACHILLGRPWQYDRRTKHDGFRNTYSFKKYGINIMLAPLNTRQNPFDALVLTKSQFVGLTKLNPHSVIFALVVAEANDIAPSNPSVIQPLLDEFWDAFPENIPPGLPLMWEIQHCIEFLPGSIIPNKPAHHMNPKEFKELHRQVNSLLEKGLVRESMSPCAVLALLVPKHGNNFTLGFFNISATNYTYLGIWYTNDDRLRRVWVANPSIPIISSSSVLMINPNTSKLIISFGGTTLVNISDNQSGRDSNLIASLEDTGNFQLRNETNCLWFLNVFVRYHLYLTFPNSHNHFLLQTQNLDCSGRESARAAGAIVGGEDWEPLQPRWG
ncbi:reverse transcriptase domain-containing protein [Tanacetum coccineum]|uniref:Reverse transcriptase domain-containing protein n=1 Tax=Tanacetum coccineum TaxID=301880 RepID=A0ABQ4YZ56_9ASTR